jgi:hypothetical protein
LRLARPPATAIPFRLLGPPVEAWRRTTDGEVAMFTKGLDLESLLAAAERGG